MSQAFLNRVRSDAAFFSSGEAASSCVFTAPNSVTVTVDAIHNKIGRKLDTATGMIINTKNASIVVAESVLLTADPLYPVRDSNEEVDMNGHFIDVADNSGVTKYYIVKETIPDEFLGLITLMLGDRAV